MNSKEHITQRSSTKFWSENLKVRRCSKDLGVDGKILIEWILGK